MSNPLNMCTLRDVGSGNLVITTPGGTVIDPMPSAEAWEMAGKINAYYDPPRSTDMTRYLALMADFGITPHVQHIREVSPEVKHMLKYLNVDLVEGTAIDIWSPSPSVRYWGDAAFLTVFDALGKFVIAIPCRRD
jgi:hypothetical protein